MFSCIQECVSKLGLCVNYAPRFARCDERQSSEREEREKERKREGGERGERREEIEPVRPHPPSFPPPLIPGPPPPPCPPPPPHPLTTLAEPCQESRSARMQGPQPRRWRWRQRRRRGQGWRSGCCCRRPVLQLKALGTLGHTHICMLAYVCACCVCTHIHVRAHACIHTHIILFVFPSSRLVWKQTCLDPRIHECLLGHAYLHLRYIHMCILCTHTYIRGRIEATEQGHFFLCVPYSQEQRRLM